MPELARPPARLTGSWQWAASPRGSWHFNPTAEVVWFDERAEGFTNSYGVDISGQSVRLGRFKAGPELSYRHVTQDGTVIEPRVAAQALWAFSRSGSGASGSLDAVSGSGMGAAPLEEFQMRFEAGLKVERSDGARLEIEGHYTGLGKEGQESIGGRLGMTLPLQ